VREKKDFWCYRAGECDAKKELSARERLGFASQKSIVERTNISLNVDVLRCCGCAGNSAGLFD
jgi:hypothetical protein